MIIAEYCEKIGHHELQAARAEEERRILREELWQQKLEFREAHQQSLTDKEKLRKFQSSTFDTIAKRKFIKDPKPAWRWSPPQTTDSLHLNLEKNANKKIAASSSSPSHQRGLVSGACSCQQPDEGSSLSPLTSPAKHDQPSPCSTTDQFGISPLLTSTTSNECRPVVVPAPNQTSPSKTKNNPSTTIRSDYLVGQMLQCPCPELKENAARVPLDCQPPPTIPGSCSSGSLCRRRPSANARHPGGLNP